MAVFIAILSENAYNQRYLSQTVFSMFSALAYLPSFLIACTGGVIANLLNLPIPWLLGSLFAVGCMSLSGLPIKTAGFSRKAGLMVT